MTRSEHIRTTISASTQPSSAHIHSVILRSRFYNMTNTRTSQDQVTGAPGSVPVRVHVTRSITSVCTTGSIQKDTTSESGTRRSAQNGHLLESTTSCTGILDTCILHHVDVQIPVVLTRHNHGVVRYDVIRLRSRNTCLQHALFCVLPLHQPLSTSILAPYLVHLRALDWILVSRWSHSDTLIMNPRI